MTEFSWYHEFRGAARFWIAALVFALAGITFTVVGALVEPFFLFIGLPFLGLGLLILALLVYGLNLKRQNPERYPIWLWWVNFIGGLAGALVFAAPSTLALPILLLVDVPSETIWIGALFSVIGIVTLVIITLIAKWQYGKRPR
ncbi:MAG: hypothetical protein ACOYZ7_17555 [Chloroflexota bacterium]